MNHAPRSMNLGTGQTRAAENTFAKHTSHQGDLRAGHQRGTRSSRARKCQRCKRQRGNNAQKDARKSMSQTHSAEVEPAFLDILKNRFEWAIPIDQTRGGWELL